MEQRSPAARTDTDHAVSCRAARVFGGHLHAANEPPAARGLSGPLQLHNAHVLEWHRWPAPRRIEGEAESIHQARRAAIARLGTSWLKHPDYRFSPRHSNHPDVYTAARREYLAAIARHAAADRCSNPAWLDAEVVRQALAGAASWRMAR